MSEMESSSYLYGANAIFIEEMYQKYAKDPNSVDEQWQQFFSNFSDDAESILQNVKGRPWKPNQPRIVGYIEKEKPGGKKGGKPSKGSAANTAAAKYTVQVLKLIDAYRAYGHIKVKIDPLGLSQESSHTELNLKNYDLDDVAMSYEIDLSGELGFGVAKIADIVSKLEQIYSGRVGAEFFHIENFDERRWLQDRFESTLQELTLSQQDRVDVLQYLIEAETFEHYLHTKFPGTKRFSLEGGEGMVAAMQFLKRTSVQYGVEEVVVGMAHRGRLNTLTNIMGKPFHAMFSEFKGELAYPDFVEIPGDVKYHLGYSNDIEIGGKPLHVSLTPNPSHLEVVNSVVLGKVRAKQDLKGDVKREKVVGLLVHGDAAFSGQGSVAESLYLSQLDGFHTGGTLHLIVNNQIGFTTNPEDSRSTRYCSDLAKSMDCPILHVNGDDAEAVVYVCKLAAEYRAKFKKDVFVDLVCYRKYGHNEGDEPLFTQPIMYKTIKQKKPPSAIFAEKLASQGVITMEDYQKRMDDFKQMLEEEFEKSKSYKPTKADWLEGYWGGFKARKEGKERATGYPKAQLKALMDKMVELPEGFALNSKVARLLKTRKDSIDSGEGIDWGTGEALAFAALLDEGTDIRITGQDVKRGTFSHRHAVFFDQENEKQHIPLNSLPSDKAGKLEIHNSNLSEFGVLGFEYGCSFTDPNKLVIWEAQFGDFANTAQVIIDQYISSGEAKWLRMSGLTLLLPHGYEGQGPEHSSARLERFLQLCAKDNMQVLNCTTPASIFHAIRRQMHRDFRKPLIVMSPKSLLRHKMAVSKLEDFDKDTKFAPLIPEHDTKIKAKSVKKVIFCSGKVYYDLLEERENRKDKTTAIIRLEQLYPFPAALVKKELQKYGSAKKVIWCQEEHENMGAYFFVGPRVDKLIKDVKHGAGSVTYVGRDESASPAVGYMKLHQHELQEILKTLFESK